MERNVIVEGKPRVGWFIDGLPDTPEIAAMLQDTGKQILLSLPTKGMGGPDPYRRWFMANTTHFRDDPDRTRHSYQPPRVMIFRDNDGPVVLVGCHAAGMSSSLDAGIGRIVPNFAVLGGRNLKYDKINGLRTELPSLALWSEQQSVHTRPQNDPDGRVQRVEVLLDAPSEIPLARRMNLTLRPTWRTSRPDKIGTFAAHDVVQLATSSSRPASWEDHLHAHVAIRELLVLAAWRNFGFLRVEVNRTDDPERLLSGKPIGPRWAEVATHRIPMHKEWSKSPQFLFTYSDIGTRGVRRWLKLRSHFARAMQPLVGIADEESAHFETRMVHSGIALEALGYQIAADRSGKNRQLTYMDALQVVLDDMAHVPLHDQEDWKQRARDCYMAVKHPDNPLPDSLVLANTQRENLLVLRVWLASRLGCPKAIIERHLPLDPLSNEYVLIG